MPPRSRSQRASSTSLLLSNDENGHRDRPHVDPGELCVGCIIWLPRKAQSAENIKCTKSNCCGQELDDAGYEHPAVVLATRQKEGSRILGDLICTVAFITTFENTSLQKYLKKRRRNVYLQESIPIFDPATALLETATMEATEYLFVENGALRKQSYVKLKHTYEIPSSSLCQYSFRAARARRAYSLRLKEDSCILLMKKLELEMQEFVATSQMLSTRESRLRLLAQISIANITSSSPSPRPRPPPSSTPYRSALVHGTVSPSPPTPSQTFPPRVRLPRYPSAPNPAPHTYHNTIPSHYHNSTHYGTMSSSIPTYQPPQPGRNTRRHDHRGDEDGGGYGFGIVVLVTVVIGAFLYWKFWS